MPFVKIQDGLAIGIGDGRARGGGHLPSKFGEKLFFVD